MSFALFKVRQRKKRWCRRKTEKRVKARVLQKQSQDEAGALPPALLTGMTSIRRHAGPALRNWLFIINLTVPFVLSVTPLIFPTVSFEGVFLSFFSFYLRFCLLRKTKASLLYLVKSCPTGSNQQGIALCFMSLCFLSNPPPLTLAAAHLRRHQDHANRTRLEETLLKVEKAVLQTGGDEAMRSRAQNRANG